MGIIDVNVDELPDSDVVPRAKYKFRIDEASEAELDKNQIRFTKLKYSIIEGEYVNRKVNDNYVPLEGKAKLKRILRASGWPAGKRLATTQDLVGLEFEAIVGVEESEAFGEQNRIVTYIVPGEGSKDDKKPTGARPPARARR